MYKLYKFIRKNIRGEYHWLAKEVQICKTKRSFI